MKDYRSLYGPRKYSKILVPGSHTTKYDIIQEIEKKHDEKVKKCLKLFYDKNEGVTGWLVITKSRIIFYLAQNINRFKDTRRVVWIIDNIPLRKIKPQIKDENVIDLNGKEVIFSLDEYSADRLLKEIKSSLRRLSKSNLILVISKVREKLKATKIFLLNPWVIGCIIIVCLGILLYFGFINVVEGVITGIITGIILTMINISINWGKKRRSKDGNG